MLFLYIMLQYVIISRNLLNKEFICMKKIKKIKGMNKIYLTLFLCGVLLPLNLKKRDSISQNIVKAMEDEISETSASKSDLWIQSAQYCVVRIPSLNSEGKYDYSCLNLKAFSHFMDSYSRFKYEENTVPFKVLKCPLKYTNRLDDSFYFDESIFLDYKEDFYFEEAKTEYFNKKEYDILEKIYKLESYGGAIFNYNNFIDGLPHTVVDYKKNEKDYNDKSRVYDFCAAANAAKNKELYKKLNDLVEYLVPLGRELSECISSKFEKEANEIKKAKEEKEEKGSSVYLRCIPFEKNVDNGQVYFVYTPEEDNYLQAMNIVNRAMKYLVWRIKQYASILAYMEWKLGYKPSFYCEEYSEDAKYEFYNRKLKCYSENFRKNINMEGNTRIICIQTASSNEFFIDQLKAKEPDIVLVDAIKHIEKLKAEYLVNKKLELLENKGELIKQLKDGITIEYNLSGVTPKDLKDIGVKTIEALKEKLDEIIKEARSEKILDQIVEDVIKEAAENSKIKKLFDDIENIFQDGVDKIIENLITEGNKKQFNREEMEKILKTIILKILGRESLYSCGDTAELKMKLIYEINKLINDKYPEINREKIYKVWRASHINEDYLDYLTRILSNFLRREIPALGINAVKDKEGNLIEGKYYPKQDEKTKQNK